MALTKLTEEQEFENVLNNNTQFLMFKHSLTCPISKAAFDEYHQFLEEHKELPSYYLAVQEGRSLSNFIAEKFEIKHESPQIFYFENGSVKWHTSHGKITKVAIEEVTELGK